MHLVGFIERKQEAMCQFKYTKQKATDSGEIQRGVRTGMRAHFVYIVMPKIFFWNTRIWREMSRISVSDDADGACGVPSFRQQTDDNFRDYLERCQQFSWALHVVLCSIFTLNGTIKEQTYDSNDVLLTCRLPVTPAYIMPSHGNIYTSKCYVLSFKPSPFSALPNFSQNRTVAMTYATTPVYTNKTNGTHTASSWLVTRCSTPLCVALVWILDTTISDKSLAMISLTPGTSLAYRMLRRPDADKASNIVRPSWNKTLQCSGKVSSFIIWAVWDRVSVHRQAVITALPVACHQPIYANCQILCRTDVHAMCCRNGTCPSSSVPAALP